MTTKFSMVFAWNFWFFLWGTMSAGILETERCWLGVCTAGLTTRIHLCAEVVPALRTYSLKDWGRRGGGKAAFMLIVWFVSSSALVGCMSENRTRILCVLERLAFLFQPWYLGKLACMLDHRIVFSSGSLFCCHLRKLAPAENKTKQNWIMGEMETFSPSRQVLSDFFPQFLPLCVHMCVCCVWGGCVSRNQKLARKVMQVSGKSM